MSAFRELGMKEKGQNQLYDPPFWYLYNRFDSPCAWAVWQTGIPSHLFTNA